MAEENSDPDFLEMSSLKVIPENTERGSITIPLTSCLTGLDWSVLQIKTTIVSCHATDSKPVKQEVNSTVILPPLVFPAEGMGGGQGDAEMAERMVTGALRIWE